MFEQLFDKAVRGTGGVGATWGSATIRELTLNVGESIRADFAWLDAEEFAGYYAVMGIIDPTGETRVGYIEYDNANGSHTLYCIADMVGTWKAKIFVWNGYTWLVYIDTVEVISSNTWGSANFQESSAVVGDIIHADFIWANAHKIGDIYAAMWIFDPDNMVKAFYYELMDATGSNTLECVTDSTGTWRAKIEVWDGSNWLVYIDTLEVTPSSEIILAEAVTCLWVDGYNNHGEEVTEFDISDDVYAYIEVHGDDLYGKTVRHEWWYKATGESDFTKRWDWSKTCEYHHTEWATWTWFNIGMSYGSGTGYIAVFVDDVYLGKTNDYNISGEGLALITSVDKPSEFIPNVEFQMFVSLKNVGDSADHLFVKLTNTDTNEVLKDCTSFDPVLPGNIWTREMLITLTQITDFHGFIEAGHIV